MAIIRTLTVDGVNFRVRTPWGIMRAFARRLAEIEAANAGELGQRGERARELAAEEAAREMLGQVIVGWDGVEDDAGQPVEWSPERLDDLDAATVAELLRRLGERPGELGPGKAEWLALVRSYVQGRPVHDAPLPLLLDALLTRYPGYSAAELLEEDHYLVQALLDVACAANDEANRSWQD